MNEIDVKQALPQETVGQVAQGMHVRGLPGQTESSDADQRAGRRREQRMVDLVGAQHPAFERGDRQAGEMRSADVMQIEAVPENTWRSGVAREVARPTFGSSSAGTGGRGEGEESRGKRARRERTSDGFIVRGLRWYCVYWSMCTEG